MHFLLPPPPPPKKKIKPTHTQFLRTIKELSVQSALHKKTNFKHFVCEDATLFIFSQGNAISTQELSIVHMRSTHTIQMLLLSRG